MKKKEFKNLLTSINQARKIHKNKIKVDKEFIKKLKPYWEKVVLLEMDFYSKLCKLEEQMTNDLKMDETLEFFMMDNSIVGIGNITRTMRLIRGEEIEKEK